MFNAFSVTLPQKQISTHILLFLLFFHILYGSVQSNNIIALVFCSPCELWLLTGSSPMQLPRFKLNVLFALRPLYKLICYVVTCIVILQFGVTCPPLQNPDGYGHFLNR